MNLKRIIFVAAVLIGVATLMSLSGCFYAKDKTEQESTIDQSPDQTPDQLSIQDENFSAAGARSKIATTATLYLGYTACKYGGFASPSGSSSCVNGVPMTGWCDEFAGFIWAKSGVVNTSRLVGYPGPGGFVHYGPVSQTPHLGDVAIMSPPGKSWNSHVAIVTAISSSGWVTMVGGNEGGGQGKVAYSYYKAGYYEREPKDGSHYHVRGYVSPKLK